MSFKVLQIYRNTQTLIPKEISIYCDKEFMMKGYLKHVEVSLKLSFVIKNIQNDNNVRLNRHRNKSSITNSSICGPAQPYAKVEISQGTKISKFPTISCRSETKLKCVN